MEITEKLVVSLDYVAFLTTQMDLKDIQTIKDATHNDIENYFEEYCPGTRGFDKIIQIIKIPGEDVIVATPFDYKSETFRWILNDLNKTEDWFESTLNYCHELIKRRVLECLVRQDYISSAEHTDEDIKWQLEISKSYFYYITSTMLKEYPWDMLDPYLMNKIALMGHCYGGVRGDVPKPFTNYLDNNDVYPAYDLSDSYHIYPNETQVITIVQVR